MHTLLSPIIDIEQAMAGDFQIIDCRDSAQFARAHAASALHFSAANVCKSVGSTSGLLPDCDDLAIHLAKAGIDFMRPTVVMDTGTSPSAARLVWVLRLIGMNAAMLDGGFSAWQASAAECEAGAAHLQQECHAHEFAYNVASFITGEQLLAKLHSQDHLLIDCRSSGEYCGLDVRAARGGHIPGALHYDWNLLKIDEHQLKPIAQLGAEMRAFLQQAHYQQQSLICYCQTHMRSSVMCLVLEALGYANVKGYVGSWSDWGNQPALPIA